MNQMVEVDGRVLALASEQVRADGRDMGGIGNIPPVLKPLCTEPTEKVSVLGIVLHILTL